MESLKTNRKEIKVETKQKRKWWEHRLIKVGEEKNKKNEWSRRDQGKESVMWKRRKKRRGIIFEKVKRRGKMNNKRKRKGRGGKCKMERNRRSNYLQERCVWTNYRVDKNNIMCRVRAEMKATIFRRDANNWRRWRKRRNGVEYCVKIGNGGGSR